MVSLWGRTTLPTGKDGSGGRREVNSGLHLFFIRKARGHYKQFKVDMLGRDQVDCLGFVAVNVNFITKVLCLTGLILKRTGKLKRLPSRDCHRGAGARERGLVGRWRGHCYSHPASKHCT